MLNFILKLGSIKKAKHLYFNFSLRLRTQLEIKSWYISNANLASCG